MEASTGSDLYSDDAKFGSRNHWNVEVLTLPESNMHEALAQLVVHGKAT